MTMHARTDALTDDPSTECLRRLITNGGITKTRHCR